jgi:hypothetical protein
VAVISTMGICKDTRLVILLGDADDDLSRQTCLGWTTRWLKGLIALRVVYGTSITARSSPTTVY